MIDKIDFEGLTFQVSSESTSEPMFLAKDIGKILGLNAPNISRFLKDNLRAKDYRTISGGQGRPSYYVTEAGLYDLILLSSTEKARDFKYWILDFVLPNIRKNGYYLDPNATIPQLEAMVREIQHHKNWTPEQFLTCLEEDQDDRKALWQDF